MTELEELIAVTKRAVVLLAAMDARLGRIEREVCNPLYQIADDGVITRINSYRKFSDKAKVVPIRMGIPEGEGSL